MFLRFFSMVFILSFSTYSYSLDIKNIEKYKVTFSEEAKSLLGQYPSVGSSLKFSSSANGKLYFYGITDRGPNQTFEENGKNFVVVDKPNFVPSIVKIEVSQETKTAKIVEVLPLSYKGKPVTGMFNQDSKVNNRKIEVPLDIYGNEIKNTNLGLDPEGIALTSDGNFWVSDEYFPSLNYVTKNGSIIKHYTAGNGLPEIIKWRPTNRGFESIAATPNGKVYLILESVLDVDYKTKNIAKFLRIFEFSPDSLETRMFAYPYDGDVYKTSDEGIKVKIGDIDALNNNEFLLIEQGSTKNGGFRNAVFKINLKDAIDITGKKLANGKDLEYGVLDEVKQYFMPKTKVFEARDFAWKHKKMEGVAVIDDKTIAVINDNDFGIDSLKKLTANNGPKFEFIPSQPQDRETEIWVVSFKDSLVNNDKVF